MYHNILRIVKIELQYVVEFQFSEVLWKLCVLNKAEAEWTGLEAL